MDQITMLYKFQVEDLKADRIEKDLKNSKLRKQLEKARAGFMDCQKQHKQIEDEIANLSDRKDAISDALNRSRKQLENLQARYSSIPDDSLDAVRALLVDVNDCLDTIKGYEEELRRISNTVRDSSQRASKLRNDGLGFRKEFEQLKPQYDAESAKMKAEFIAQRKLADQKKEGIEAHLLAKYNEVKMRVSPPIALIVNRDQCSGCHTRLNNAIKQRVSNASLEIVECQNCGRMLYSSEA